MWNPEAIWNIWEHLIGVKRLNAPMSFGGVSSLPSRAWSCGTLADGIAACANIAGISLDSVDLADPVKAGFQLLPGLLGVGV